MPVYSYDRVMLEMVLLKEKRINTPAELSRQHVAQSDPKPRLMMVPNLGKQLVGELIDSLSFVFVGRSFCFSMNMHGYVRHDFPGAVIVIYDIAKYIKSLLHFLKVFKGLFLMWTIFLVFIEFVTISLLFCVLVFPLQSTWDVSSLTRDWTHTHFALEGEV